MTTHVLHVISSLREADGGPAHMLASLCDALVRVGLRVSIAVQYLESPDESVLPSFSAIKILSLPSQGWKKYLVEYCLSEKVTIIHNHGLWLGSNHLAAVVSRLCNLPLVSTTHGMLRPWALSHKQWKKEIAWWLYQGSDVRLARVLHSTCPGESEELRTLGLCNAIAEVPIGINLDELKPKQAHPSGKRVLLFMGRLHPVKGLMNLVKAIDCIRPDGWICIVAGPCEGGFRKELENEIDTRKIDDYFDFVGSVSGDEKWALFYQAELFVLPSYTENFGVVVLEALSCGVPVLSTDATPWSILPAVGCGWSIPVGLESLTEALKECMTLEAHELRAMGKLGRKLVESSFSWQSIAQQMKAVYEWCLTGEHPPECMRFFKT